MAGPENGHKDGYEVDSNGRGYDPDSGSTEPVEGRCNALLTNWKERYGEKRYCTGIVPQKVGEDYGPFCKQHRDREALYMKAKEALKTGLNTKTVEHFVDKIDPVEQIVVWGFYDDLLTESIYDFETEYVEEEFDLSESEYEIPLELESLVDDYGKAHIELPNVQTKLDSANALWNAAVFGMNMTKANATVWKDELRTKSTDHADLVVPDDGQPFHMTIDQWNEHYLNLPLSRLVRDRRDLLEHGGVGVEDASEVEESGPDTVIEYYEDPLDKDGIEPESLQGDAPLPQNLE